MRLHKVPEFPSFPQEGVVDGHAKPDGPQVVVIGEQNEVNSAGKVAREPHWLVVVGANQFVVGFDLQNVPLSAAVQMTDEAFCVPVVQHGFEGPAMVAEQGIVGHDQRRRRGIGPCRKRQAGSLPACSGARKGGASGRLPRIQQGFSC